MTKSFFLYIVFLSTFACVLFGGLATASIVFAEPWYERDGWQTIVLTAYELPMFDSVDFIEYEVDFNDRIIYLERGYGNFKNADDGGKPWDKIMENVDLAEMSTTTNEGTVITGNIEVVPKYEFIYAPANMTHFHKVPIIYLADGEFPCGHKEFQACHHSGADGQRIEFFASQNIFDHKQGKVNPDIKGMSTWEHEVLHAWGVSHDDMLRWFNPIIPVDCSLQKCPTFPRQSVSGHYIR